MKRGNKKAALEFEVPISLILGLLVLSLSIYFIFIEYWTGNDTDREICRQSVILRSTFLESTDTIAFEKLAKKFPLKCQNEVITIDYKNYNKAGYEIVDAMARCAALYGNGELPIYPTNLLESDFYCLHCARIHFTEEVRDFYSPPEYNIKENVDDAKQRYLDSLNQLDNIEIEYNKLSIQKKLVKESENLEEIKQKAISDEKDSNEYALEEYQSMYLLVKAVGDYPQPEEQYQWYIDQNDPRSDLFIKLIGILKKEDIEDTFELKNYLLGRIALFSISEYDEINKIVSQNNIETLEELLELYSKLIDEKSEELKEAQNTVEELDKEYTQLYNRLALKANEDESFHWTWYGIKKMKGTDKTYNQYIYGDNVNYIISSIRYLTTDSYWIGDKEKQSTITYDETFDARKGDIIITNYISVGQWNLGAILADSQRMKQTTTTIAHQPQDNLICEHTETIPA